MSAGHTVTITPSDAHVEVRLGGRYRRDAVLLPDRTEISVDGEVLTS